MQPPIKGMTLRPWGEDYMVDAFIGLVRHLLSVEEAREAFKRSTGYDIMNLVGQPLINQMVDKATGHANTVIAAFGDWVAEKHWGVEDE